MYANIKESNDTTLNEMREQKSRKTRKQNFTECCNECA